MYTAFVHACKASNKGMVSVVASDHANSQPNKPPKHHATTLIDNAEWVTIRDTPYNNQG